MTDAGALQKIDNRVTMIGDANHEMVVNASGTVDGCTVSLDLVLGRSREGRRWIPAANSQLEEKLAPEPVGSGADGYVKTPGQKAELDHDRWAYPARSGVKAPAVEQFIPWEKK